MSIFPQKTKPRTYRKQIKKQVLSVLKTKKPSKKKIRTAKKRLLHALNRNIGYLNELFDRVPQCLSMLDRSSYRNWLVIQHIYQQQQHMFDQQTNRVADRIVSLHQPWVRPIVSGKAGKMVEFGAQINMSERDGYVSFDQVEFDKFNEAMYLKQGVENYQQKHGYYPQAVLVDRIYLNRENRKWLDQMGIKHYGPALGRPKQMPAKQKRERQQIQNKRSEIEGKFGQAKMVFGMNRIATRTYQSSLAKIGLIAMAMNIWRLLKEVSFLSFLKTLCSTLKIAKQQTIETMIILLSNHKWKPLKIYQPKILKISLINLRVF